MAVNVCLNGNAGQTNKKSIFGSFGLRILFISLLFVNTWVSVDGEISVSCANATKIFEKSSKKNMLALVDLKEQPYLDSSNLCKNKGCCGPAANTRLVTSAKWQLQKMLSVEISKLSAVLASRAARFDKFFRTLLVKSREEFHAMFKRTYGMIYEQHAYLFEELFNQLEQYYGSGDIDLVNTMNHFFGVLYEKMFTVLNSQYSFDESYLKCVNEHMRDTQPFEDVPHKLSVQLRRAFVATRTFHKALVKGAEIAHSMNTLDISEECSTMWARMQWCGACAGVEVLPCSRFCHNVLRGCLPKHADISADWDAYVDALDKVSERLLGPFNIVMVVEPIDIKISEAIMTFQEHNQDISQKIFAGCGKPVLGGGGGAGPFFAPERSRRSLKHIPDFDWQQNTDMDDFEIETSFESVLKEDPMLLDDKSSMEMPEFAERMKRQAEGRGRFLRYMRGEINSVEYEERDRSKRDADPIPAPAPASAEIDFKPYEFEGGKKKNSKKSSPVESDDSDTSEWGSQELERLVREARTRLRNSRRYWEHLPYLLCTDLAAPPSPPGLCFNGTHVDSYTRSPAGEGSAALASNPEVSGKVYGKVGQQEVALKLLTTRLKDAFNGVDVHWPDDAATRRQPPQDLLERAGSGSGSGDDDDSIDDDEDYYHGSGDSSSDPEEPDDTERETDKVPLYRPPPPPADPEAPLPPPPPFTPVVIGGGGETRNVHLTGPVVTLEDTPPHGDRDTDIDGPSEENNRDNVQVKEQPVRDSADSLSLHKALLTYALPVVCAWFGTIVTDLF